MDALDSTRLHASLIAKIPRTRRWRVILCGRRVKDFRQLKVWQKSPQLALALYQIRRAASSIPSNLAEGCGRNGDAELARFCCILPRDLKLIQPNAYEQLSQQTTEIKRMLTVFVQKLTAES